MQRNIIWKGDVMMLTQITKFCVETATKYNASDSYRILVGGCRK
jgi:hypothetical protein